MTFGHWIDCLKLTSLSRFIKTSYSKKLMADTVQTLDTIQCWSWSNKSSVLVDSLLIQLLVRFCPINTNNWAISCSISGAEAVDIILEVLDVLWYVPSHLKHLTQYISRLFCFACTAFGELDFTAHSMSVDESSILCWTAAIGMDETKVSGELDLILACQMLGREGSTLLVAGAIW